MRPAPTARDRVRARVRADATLRRRDDVRGWREEGSGRGSERAEDAQGTPTQNHMSPYIFLYTKKDSHITCRVRQSDHIPHWAVTSHSANDCHITFSIRQSLPLPHKIVTPPNVFDSHTTRRIRESQSLPRETVKVVEHRVVDLQPHISCTPPPPRPCSPHSGRHRHFGMNRT